MKTFTLFRETEKEQIAVGKLIAQQMDFPLLVFLNGDLGAGKSTLARAVIQARGFKGAVKSPTYTLMEPYEFKDNIIYHLDLYRLADDEELEYLGLRDILDHKESALFIEWSENGVGWLPEADLIIDITHEKKGRSLLFSSNTKKGISLIDSLQEHFL